MTRRVRVERLVLSLSIIQLKSLAQFGCEIDLRAHTQMSYT